MTDERKLHWENVYSSKVESEVSWFQETPEPSMDLLALTGADTRSAIIDIGGGASRFVDALLDAGFAHISVLDLSEAALVAARKRLGDRGGFVKWIVADVTSWEPVEIYDIWHDRAAFHFLTTETEQQAYLVRLKRALRLGGHAILGTFAPNGPEKCSGLPVARYDSQSLAKILGDGFELIDSRRHEHTTPWGAVQKFHFGTFIRTA